MNNIEAKKPEIEQLQRIWDECLIDSWRSHGKLLDAMTEFLKLTGQKILDVGLLRTPHIGMPWQMPSRVFVAQYLEKISNRLWEQPKERDVALIDKLQTSKYTTTKSQTNPDNELAAEQKRHRKNTARNAVDAKRIASRNHDTDWNVTK